MFGFIKKKKKPAQLPIGVRVGLQASNTVHRQERVVPQVSQIDKFKSRYKGDPFAPKKEHVTLKHPVRTHELNRTKKAKTLHSFDELGSDDPFSKD